MADATDGNQRAKVWQRLLILLLVWIAAAYAALQQAPRPDISQRNYELNPLHGDFWKHSITSLDFWQYPIERNPAARLPSISASLYDVHFATPDRGWAVGSAGVIVSTQDGGASWKPRPSGTNSRLRSVHFATPDRGWAVGEGGEIVSTQDGGASWKRQSSGTNQILYSVHFATPDRGWAVSDEGVIVSTQDGGASWKRQSSGTNQILYSVHFATPDRGWAVGEGGVIVSTQDSGATWKAQTSGTTQRLLSVHFATAERGWAVGAGGVIVSTQDGGASWKPQTSGTDQALLSVHFATPDRGWAVANEGEIVSTQDGGASWTPQTSGTGQNLLSVYFAMPDRGWAVGAGGVIVSTQDGGASWEPQTSWMTERLLSVYFVTADRGWAVGPDGVIVSTQDGGASWTPQPSGTTERLRSVHFATPDLGWAVGSGGVIVSTQHGGASWKQQPSGTTEHLRSVHFATPDRGWAVGESGVIVSTRDGGASWKPQASGTGQTLLSVHFATPDRGWAVGSAGEIVSTQDGGAMWKPQTNLVYGDFNSVHFTTPDRGYAVGRQAIGDNAVIVSTQDGGESWRRQLFGTYRELYSGHFATSERGWAVGLSGVILLTQDGGKTWRGDSLGTRPDNLIGHWDGSDGDSRVLTPAGIVFRQAPTGGAWEPLPPSRWAVGAVVAPWFYLFSLVLAGLMVGIVRQRDIDIEALNDPGHSDSAVTALSDDRLLAVPRVLALSSFLRNDKTKPPLVIGIDGEWGTGKSTVMRMLQGDLRAHGGRTVWFNAWHHQNDDEFFAALLDAIRRDVRPSLLTPAGWTYLGRLLAHRLRKQPIRVGVALGLPAALIGFWLGVHALTGPVEQLASNVAPTRLEAVRDAALCLGLGTGCPGLTTNAYAAEKRNAVGSEPTSTAKPATNQAADKTGSAITSVAAQGTVAGEILKVQMVPEPKPDGPLATLGARWDRVAAHHEPMLALLALLLAAIPALMPIFAAMAPFPNPAALTATRRWFGLRANDREPSYRYRFARDFADVTAALPTRLYLFVDDLDRCLPETTAKLLEAVNFLIESGQLIVVLGLAKEKVRAGIGLAASDLAIDLGTSKLPRSASDVSDRDKAAYREAYANEFLRKLVNLWVDVPPVDQAGATAMLTNADAVGRTQSVEWIDPPTWLTFVDKQLPGLAVVALLLAAAVVGNGAGDWLAAGAELREVAAPVPIIANAAVQEDGVPNQAGRADGNGASTTASANTAQRPQQGQLASPRIISEQWFSPEMFALGGTGLVLALAALIQWMFRDRFLTRDPPELRLALAAWSGLIALRHPSPRELRRFQNRVSFVAARLAVFQKVPKLVESAGPLRRLWYARYFERQRQRHRKAINERSAIMEPLFMREPVPPAFIVGVMAVLDTYPNQQEVRWFVERLGELAEACGAEPKLVDGFEAMISGQVEHIPKLTPAANELGNFVMALWGGREEPAISFAYRVSVQIASALLALMPRSSDNDPSRWPLVRSFETQALGARLNVLLSLYDRPIAIESTAKMPNRLYPDGLTTMRKPAAAESA